MIKHTKNNGDNNHLFDIEVATIISKTVWPVEQVAIVLNDSWKEAEFKSFAQQHV